ncbi:MBOAT-domain-containing protein [Venturia nashicola]|uniref:O-acyltransferase n=1 Tax=Venturia nashicola TaxID=86259 RepID=A0A4Z1P483_9PEZI|nr:MBOAT-domain-containing protein [Venturia nashicola]
MSTKEPTKLELPPPQTAVGATLLDDNPQLRRISVSTGSGDEWSANPSTNISDEEDYDRLKPNPLTLVEGSSGGGLQEQRTMNRHNTQNGVDALVPEHAVVEQAFEAIKAASPNFTTQSSGRRKSIQVTVEKTGKKGRYILTADDPEFREILRSQIVSESDTDGKQTRGFRDLVFTRRFTTFDRQNPLGSESPFYGFFTLFWLSIGMMLVRIAAQNWKMYGNILGSAELFHVMFDRDIVVLGLTDGVMCVGTMFGLGLQKVILKGYLSWNRHGWIIQNLWQTFYLFAVIAWTWYRDWPWTHTVFVLLHGLTFVMKQHSYAFYNGYLSQMYRRRQILQEKLQQLDLIEPAASPSSSGFTTSLEEPQKTSQHRPQVSRTSTNLSSEKSGIASIAAAIDSGEGLDEEQLDSFSRSIHKEINSLTTELTGKCTSGVQTHYPQNLTIANWADWTCLPTLVYELEYPRQEHINWWYVAEKTAATFGVIWVMMVVSQTYIYPPVAETVRMKEAGMTLQQRWQEFPWILGDMLFPLLLEQLLTWYVIWECCLNVLAELTRFADRGFYGDWWNSVSWDQYARDWNRPVHNFLLRHVYHSSISAFHLSKFTATFVTFFLSACVHELVMLCLFKKVRGYLFIMQLGQLPLVALSRTKLLKGRDTLGNIIFWFGLFVGPSLITSLYLIV